MKKSKKHMPEDHKQTPTTVKEVGIHVGYLREDIGEIKELLSKHIEIAALKADVDREFKRVDERIDEIEVSVEKIGTRQSKKEESENAIYRRVTYIVIAGIVIMVLAWYGLDKFFKL